MGNLDRNAERPPLDPSDVYRPRLGTQKAPLSRTTMAELQAWRKAKAAAEPCEQAQGRYQYPTSA
jgi:hypothetical protein